MKGLVIEKGSGVALSKYNLVIKDETNMENIEYWESRLEFLKQPYVTAFRKVGKKVFYSIFAEIGKKESKFK